MSQYYKQVGPSLDGFARAAGKDSVPQQDADFVHKTPGGFHHGFEHAGHKYEFHTDLNSNEVEVHKNGQHVHTGNTAYIHSYLHRKHSKGAANKYAEQTNSKEMDF